MVYIRDDIHGTIEIRELEKKIIDTWDFNRLHWIKQMGFANLVYPGANHTRFEHSLGTMELAGRISRALNLDKTTHELARIYGLLHDVGHLPFSHEGERALQKWIGNHEKIGKDIIMRGEISDILRTRFSRKEISRIVNPGKSIETTLTASDLGADRMDYLIRDNRNTGVAYGTIDVERIITQIGLDKRKGMYINEGGIVAAESLLIGRHMMFCSVYLHHTVRIISAMLVAAIRRAVELDGVDPKQFIGMTDMDAIQLLRSSPHASGLIERIMKRKLYKRLRVYKRKEDIPKSVLNKVDNYNLMLDVPHPFVKPVSILVRMKGRGDRYTFKRLDKISSLVSTLDRAEDEVKTVMLIGKR